MLNKLKNNMDITLLITVFLLFSTGMVLIISATHMQENKKLILQFASFTIGFIIIVLSNFFDYTRVKNYYKQLYILCIFLLLIVWVPGIGDEQMGARSWIKLPGVFLQTSEIVKPLFIFIYAAYLDEHKNKIYDIFEFLKAVSYAMPIILLVFIQPDLGGALVFFMIMSGMLFIAGMDLNLIKYGMLSLMLFVPIMYKFILGPHQVKRIDSFLSIFLHPTDLALIYEKDPQVSQSMTAIGSGGISGKGWMQGSFNQYGFISVSQSDFLFPVLGEEFGLLGMSFLLIIYFIFLFRILQIAFNSKDFYGTLVATGIFSMFAYQIIQNIGMTIGLIPVTGLTMPFVSYGGSSMISAMISVAVLMNISINRKKIR